MIEEPRYEHQLTLDAKGIWDMVEHQEYTDDIECQYRGLLNFLDILYYRNGNSSYPQVRTRHTMFSLAQAMPSLAMIDPSRTREISYNLHVCANVLNFPLLTYALDCYNSESVRLAESALTLALYRLVSGNAMNDEAFHKTIDQVKEKMLYHKTYQGITALETQPGIYEIVPNLWCLLAYEIHDCIFASTYLSLKDEILSWIRAELIDQETGLYRESYKTGAFDIEGEYLNKDAFWHTLDLKDNVNALAICYMHYFDEEGSARAWDSFKRFFLDPLLQVKTEQIVSASGHSYLTQLAPVTESLYGALLTAREMGDKETFELLQRHIFEITAPSMREGKLFLDALQEEKLHCHFLLFARVHMGWKAIMEHDWAKDYGRDYKKIQ